MIDFHAQPVPMWLVAAFLPGSLPSVMSPPFLSADDFLEGDAQFLLGLPLPSPGTPYTVAFRPRGLGTSGLFDYPLMYR